MWHQAPSRDLRFWIGGDPVTGETSDASESSSPLCRSSVWVQLGPLQSQGDCDVAGALLLQKRNEIAKQRLCFAQLISQGTTHLDVVADSFFDRIHGLPPGQGNANVRSDRRSTLA